jgi:pimeloyl-ACP methyl ester carboxylesterase
VFVHGAWAGGWHYTKVEPLLEEAGFKVYRPTMTGLGERFHLAREDIGLSTHVEDIVNVLEFENLENVVLVGHSYGGMVISGVANRVPHRIRQLVYMDAIVPEDGESVMDLAGDAINSMAEAGAAGAPPWQLVPLWVKPGKLPPVDVPQSLLTFTEPIVLDNPDANSIPATYILTVEAGKDSDTFDVFADRARERQWEVVTMEGGHNPQWFQPETLVEVLLGVVGAAEPPTRHQATPAQS